MVLGRPTGNTDNIFSTRGVCDNRLLAICMPYMHDIASFIFTAISSDSRPLEFEMPDINNCF